MSYTVPASKAPSHLAYNHETQRNEKLLPSGRILCVDCETFHGEWDRITDDPRENDQSYHVVIQASYWIDKVGQSGVYYADQANILQHNFYFDGGLENQQWQRLRELTKDDTHWQGITERESQVKEIYLSYKAAPHTLLCKIQRLTSKEPLSADFAQGLQNFVLSLVKIEINLPRYEAEGRE